MGDQLVSLDGLVNASKQIAIQIGELNRTLSKAFPQTSGISGSAGAPTGTYLDVIGPDGNPYKIALLGV